MMRPELNDPANDPSRRQVDRGWGRKAVEFATFSEPSNCREYLALHQALGVRRGERLGDMACGAGPAVELGSLRGAGCTGIDASARLIAVARDRSPAADLRVGDMQALPWADGSFDGVTSFRGIWGRTPEARAEAYRVLVPGGPCQPPECHDAGRGPGAPQRRIRRHRHLRSPHRRWWVDTDTGSRGTGCRPRCRRSGTPLALWVSENEQD